MSFISAYLRHIAPYALLLLAVFAMGYWAGRGERPEPIERVVRVLQPPDVKADLQLPPRTFRPPPRIIIAERTITETRVDTIRVPITIDRYRLITGDYLHADRRHVWIRSYNPESMHYELDRFRIQQPRWSSALYAETGYSLITGWPDVSLNAELRYRSLAAGGTAAIHLDGMQPSLRAWLRYYVW
jgi:hypothetical protein